MDITVEGKNVLVSGLDRPAFSALQAKAKQENINIANDSGVSKVKLQYISWNYDEANAKLAISVDHTFASSIENVTDHIKAALIKAAA